MNKLYFTILLFSSISFAQILQVKDIFPGSSTDTPPVINSSNPTNFFDFNGILFFRAGDSNGQELWKSDGTAAGTVLVKDINTGTTAASNSNPTNFVSFNNQIYFTASNGTGTNGTEFWKTDGTTTGTLLVKDIRPGTASANAQNFTIINPTTMLFSANDGTIGTELWKTDGTEIGTVNVVDYPGTTNSITWIENLNGLGILGQIVSTTSRELYKSDGTAANSSLLLDVNPGTGLGVGSSYIKNGNTIYFQGNSGTTGLELWKTDGTISGTVLVKDINVGAAASGPIRFVNLGTTTYFRATGTNGEELWKTDGTEAGTVEVADINLGAGDSNPDEIAVANAAVYFFASDNDLNYDLYHYNGTVLTKLNDFNALSNTISSNFVAIDNLVYFAADSNSDGQRELWQTNGTVSGTVAVSSLVVGSINPTNVSQLTKVGTNLFFAATDTDGQELFQYIPQSLSIQNPDKLASIVVYPNPSSTVFQISNQSNLTLQFELYDLLGKKIDGGTLINSTLSTDLKSGVYLLKLYNETQTITKRIIKQ
jgi:ELWxxDGT repeat protein